MFRSWQVLAGATALCAMLSGCSSQAATAGAEGGSCQFANHSEAETTGGKKPGPTDPVIKGYVLNTDNSKVYYLPGAQAYKRVKIDESKGMKFFCTEKEAEAAGWKKSTV